MVNTDTATAWTMIVLGALIALDGLFSLAMPGVVYGEVVQIVLGALLFLAPWVTAFTDFKGRLDVLDRRWVNGYCWCGCHARCERRSSPRGAALIGRKVQSPRAPRWRP